jgi:hypothetical protein
MPEAESAEGASNGGEGSLQQPGDVQEMQAKMEHFSVRADR